MMTSSTTTDSFKTRLFKSDLLFRIDKVVWENLPMKVRRTEHNREVVRKCLERAIENIDYD